MAARRVLAGLWILDGLLQLLPRMYTMFMVQSVLRPPTTGEPDWLAHLTQAILVAGTEHLVAFNLALTAIQVGLGLALWIPGRDHTWPYWLSLIWCAGVWVFGEAFGGLLTGQASLVTGAPGSVALYAVLTWAAWPLRRPDDLAGRRRGVTAALAATWSLGAVLQALPVFFTAPGLSQLLLGNVNSYQPTWVNALTRWGAAHLAAAPFAANVLLITAMALAAAGMWIGGRLRGVALLASVAFAALLWGFGQAFGMLLMAMTTDPNTAPLLVALALYAWPSTGDAQAHGGAGSSLASGGWLWSRRRNAAPEGEKEGAHGQVRLRAASA